MRGAWRAGHSSSSQGQGAARELAVARRCRRDEPRALPPPPPPPAAPQCPLHRHHGLPAHRQPAAHGHHEHGGAGGATRGHEVRRAAACLRSSKFQEEQLLLLLLLPPRPACGTRTRVHHVHAAPRAAACARRQRSPQRLTCAPTQRRVRQTGCTTVCACPRSSTRSAPPPPSPRSDEYIDLAATWGVRFEDVVPFDGTTTLQDPAYAAVVLRDLAAQLRAGAIE